MIAVRPFRQSDRDAVCGICYETGYLGDSASVYWAHRASFVEVWLSWYMEREPESLFVATQSREVVGYLSGCVDSAVGPDIHRLRSRQAWRHLLYLRPGSAGYFRRLRVDRILDGVPASTGPSVRRWPSHLHANLRADIRGRGVGSALLQAWFAYLESRSSPGCHLGVVLENTQAVSFFQRHGFRRHGEPALIAGLRGGEGERLHRQWMVRELS